MVVIYNVIQIGSEQISRSEVERWLQRRLELRKGDTGRPRFSTAPTEQRPASSDGSEIAVSWSG